MKSLQIVRHKIETNRRGAIWFDDDDISKITSLFLCDIRLCKTKHTMIHDYILSSYIRKKSNNVSFDETQIYDPPSPPQSTNDLRLTSAT